MYPAGQPSLRHPSGFSGCKVNNFFRVNAHSFPFFKPIYPCFSFFNKRSRKFPSHPLLCRRKNIRTSHASATSITSFSAVAF